ncbi:MAG: hypothetical protein KGS46_21205 [Chloroflexi bacterium]|nr:hypothetical protein [Chloroflexota bacterium]
MSNNEHRTTALMTSFMSGVSLTICIGAMLKTEDIQTLEDARRMYHAAVWYRTQDASLMDEAQAALLEALPAGMSAAVADGYLPEMI